MRTVRAVCAAALAMGLVFLGHQPASADERSGWCFDRAWTEAGYEYHDTPTAARVRVGVEVGYNWVVVCYRVDVAGIPVSGGSPGVGYDLSSGAVVWTGCNADDWVWVPLAGCDWGRTGVDQVGLSSGNADLSRVDAGGPSACVWVLGGSSCVDLLAVGLTLADALPQPAGWVCLASLGPGCLLAAPTRLHLGSDGRPTLELWVLGYYIPLDIPPGTCVGFCPS